MDQVSDLHDALPSNESISLPCVHIEVCQISCSTVQKNLIKDHVSRELMKHQKAVYNDVVITDFQDPFLSEHVCIVSVCDTNLHAGQVLDLCSSPLLIHVYQLSESGPAEEKLDNEEEIAAANHWLLPCSEFNGAWENLIFDTDIKSQLLQYASTTLLFSDKNVDSNVISWNRVVLLHGPPGTGKTSLCRALAQKLVIRMSDRYTYGQLIEINSHSLFSKWFSESGKLVMKMFQKIQELVDDRDALVCVLIDEVESLTAARKASMQGSEPSDAIRVVNALLTQIDQIKKNPNVMILTTSNITGAIDLAFVDRADIKQFIGLPSPAAIYKIYQSCIMELFRTGIIVSPSDQLFDMKTLELMRFAENDATRLSLHLKEIAIDSQGLSGRTLRKMPFLAHALYVRKSSSDLGSFLMALAAAVKKQFKERSDLSEAS